MIDNKKFRIINNTEKKVIRDSLLKITIQLETISNSLNIELLISFNNLITEPKFPSIFLAPRSLVNTIRGFDSEIAITSMGVYFGFIKKNRFLLSLEGAEFLNKVKPFSEKHHLYVNLEGEKAILYGNHIRKKFLYKNPIKLERNNFLLVFNILNELISIAYSQVSYLTIDKLRPNDLIAKNLIDKGYYLRKEQ